KGKNCQSCLHLSYRAALISTLTHTDIITHTHTHTQPLSSSGQEKYICRWSGEIKESVCGCVCAQYVYRKVVMSLWMKELVCVCVCMCVCVCVCVGVCVSVSAGMLYS